MSDFDRFKKVFTENLRNGIGISRRKMRKFEKNRGMSHSTICAEFWHERERQREKMMNLIMEKVFSEFLKYCLDFENLQFYESGNCAYCVEA